MPDLDHTVLTALSETLTDVTFRTNRLKEWVELELYVLKLVGSFERLYDEMQRAFGSDKHVNMANADQKTWTRLAALWDSCRDSGLSDLEVYIGDLLYLPQPVEAGGSSTDLQLGEWLDDLQERGKQIQQAMVGCSAQPLRDSCDEFYDSLRRRIILHRQRVKKEIGFLCEVALQLRTKLESNVP